jgi:hypothetical protein
MFPWQVFGLTGSDLVARLPRRPRVQCRDGVRTCLPLRGSPGVSPGSLFILRHRKNHRNACLLYIGQRATAILLIVDKSPRARKPWFKEDQSRPEKHL